MVELVELGAARAAALGRGRVLPAAAAATVIEAETLLRAARAEAQRLLAEARAGAEAVREAARAEGVAAATEEIQDRLFAIADASVGMIAQNEEHIVELGVQIAERIVGGLPGADVVARVALRSLKLAGHSRYIRLRVAAGAGDAVRERLDASLGKETSGRSVEVIEDPRIGNGGCVLETDAGLIDATIDSQIAAIRRGLRRTLVRTED